MEMHQNSLDAYGKVRKWKNDMQMRVLDTVKRNGATTLEDICKIMDRPEHCISGRLTELKQSGVIKIVGTTKNSNGNTCSIYVPFNKHGGVV